MELEFLSEVFMRKIVFLLLFPLFLFSCASVISVDKAVEEIAWNTIDTQLIDIESGKILGGDTFEFWVNLPEE
jgi:hypothetical protein